MMNEIRRKRQILKVDHYDGQCIYSERELYYELGGYLGGGAAGVVYEAFCARTKRHVAIKILNPVGYKLLPSTLLSRCIVAVRGKPLALSNSFHDHGDGDDHDHDVLSMAFPRSQANHYNTGNSGGNLTPGGSSNRFSTTATRMQLDNVWWLIHPSTKQAVAAYEDPRTGSLRELSLPQCIDVWGSELQVDDFHDDVDRKFAQLEDAYQEVHVKNQQLRIPKIPKKFIKFASTRRTIHREISNMSGLGFHENVLRLEEALELVQDSKCTTFLVLELAAGGELFDRIKLDCGTDEDTARRYFQQLISGVAFCHSSGVCHRDLKPENLLLADTEELSTLKIADFGLSAIFAMTEQGGDPDGTNNGGSTNGPGNAARVQAIRRLRSVVGSPHYVAPEVLMDAGQGYDGAKADAWSIGVIVYAMLAGNLPFGKDLLKCLRYEKFKKWCYNTKYSDEEPVDEVAFPTWFFPAQFSLEVKSLVTQLLYPDASMRLSVEEAQRHAWVLGERLPRRASNSPVNDEHPEASPPSSLSSSSSSLLVNTPAPPSVVGTNSPPLNVIDQELPRWTHTQPQRLGNRALSPGGFSSATRLHHALHGCSPTAAPLPLGGSSGMTGHTVPPSPQKTALLRAQLMTSSAYMPSLDETAPLPSGQTPINSPRAESTTTTPTRAPATTTTLQFEMDQPSTHAGEANKIHDDSDRECQRTASPVSLQPAASAEMIPELDQPAAAASTAGRAPRRRIFTSPPLATSSLLERSSQYKHRRNSPPELCLSRFGKGFKFEAIRTALDEIDLDQFQPLAINLATTPTHTSPHLQQLHQQQQQQQQQLPAQTDHPSSRFMSSSYSSQSVPNTPMATATSTGPSPSTSNSTSGSGTGSDSGSGSVGPPSFHADLVARSTRFITTLPAQLVLTKIDAILTTAPTNATTTNKRVTIDWAKYQMDVWDGDVLTCTVQVFLFQRGVYLVEFRRGQVEIFQFKRFYEDLRETLSSSAELPTPNLSPRRSPNSSSDDNENHNHHDDGDDDDGSALSPPSSTRPRPRKRNKSIGVHAELLR